MARVTIETRAFFDPRIGVAAQTMRMASASLGWKLAQAWSFVIEASDSRMALDQIAMCVGRKPTVARRALVCAELALECDTHTLDLEPMRSLFGDFEWLEERRATAEAGGKVRARTAERDENGRFLDRDVRGDVLAALADGRPRTRAALVAALNVRRTRLHREVRALVELGTLVERDGGRVALAAGARDDVADADAADACSTVTVDTCSTVAADAAPRHQGAPALTSALAPAPALAPVSVYESECQPSGDIRAREASAVALSHSVEHAQSATADAPRAMDVDAPRTTAADTSEPEPWTDERLAATTRLVPQAERRDVARALWAYQNRRRKHIDSDAPDIPLVDVPGGSLDAVVLALAAYTPAQCTHALDIFTVEAACKRDAREDALEYLNGRTNWKSEQLARAVGTTAEAVRKRYAKRTRNGSPPAVPKSPLERIA